MPVNRWEPVTDHYKEQAPKLPEGEVGTQQKPAKPRPPKRQKPRAGAKAPLGVRIFTGYYFGRSCTCFLLLFILGIYPQSSSSLWLSDNISSFLHLPGSRGEEARRQAIGKLARSYSLPEETMANAETAYSPETTRTIVKIYLAFSLVAAALVGLKWWTRSRNVRWGTILYAGALLVRAMFNITPGSGFAWGLSPMLALTLGINGLIVLYLAFAPGVGQWFNRGS